jgi:hypothetical protein
MVADQDQHHAGGAGVREELGTERGGLLLEVGCLRPRTRKRTDGQRKEESQFFSSAMQSVSNS